MKSHRIPSSGFSIIEALVGAAVFMFISISVFQVFGTTMDAVRLSGAKVASSALANEQFEIIRNLPYDDVGVAGGIPNGKVLAEKTLERDKKIFTVKTYIRNIDDPFDGTIGGTPNDTSPADYRMVEVEISCQSVDSFKPLKFTSFIGPRGLETSSTNGALFIEVMDASGQPVSGAAVHIENASSAPPIIMDDTTNNDGMLQIIDAPPGFEAYSISVTKAGYSTDRTFQSGDAANPNPAKPHATVAVQQVTQISFAIDKTSALEMRSLNGTCVPSPEAGFDLYGAKIIGSSPDVLKYSASLETDASGSLDLNGLEWDTLSLDFTDASFDLAGTIPLEPIVLNPDSVQSFTIITAPKNPNSILVVVKDNSTQLPLSGAVVKLSKTGFEQQLITDRGFIRQTDWSGGAGQDDWSADDKYHDSDGNLEINSPAGEIKLLELFGEYVPAGYLVSSAFDTGSPSNFHQLIWEPLNQPPETGVDSVKMQAAANNDNATWNFTGPDGTATTYYTVSDQDISGQYDGNRYFRYKLIMETASSTWTSVVSDIAFTFTSSCTPPGQVLFSGLSADIYDIEISKTGYSTLSDSITAGSDWQKYNASLSP